MGFPDRDKADQDTRAAADAADGSATGDRVRIKPPSGRIVRPPRQTPPTLPPAPEGKKTPFTRAGGEVQGPVKLGDEPERPTVDPELGLNWLGAEGGSTKPIGKSWATSPPKVVKPPRKTGPKAQSDLEGFQQLQGTHPGDRYVRVVRQQRDDFQRVGPGHLVATEESLAARGPLGRTFGKVKRLLIGSPIATAQEHQERLTKVKALAVFSSDALSSVAYATEEIMKVLVLASLAALSLTLPISLVIVALLTIVIISYRQTIRAYPSGGGSYIVASDNLGTMPGLVAAASLLTDYVLTVSVSVAAGVLALTSLEPALSPYKVELAVGAVLLVMIANLRGIRESGSIFAIPTYVFIMLMYMLIGYGLYRVSAGGMTYTPPDEVLAVGSRSTGIFLLLSAFAQGCTAMTGTEAISNGVPAFKRPEATNARTTLVAMGVLLGTMFLGLSYLAQHLSIRPSDEESVLSQVGRTVFGQGFVWVALQIATALILILAANTAFADFPRLGSILARDGFLPHAFRFRGDRLAFTVGIASLAMMSSLLLIVFGGSLDHLIPLYAVGVFTSFTLSQLGMVVHWRRERGPGWRRSAVINGTGAVATGIVTLVIAATKFLHGAWLIVLLIPILILGFRAIHAHYERATDELEAQTPLDPKDIKHTVLVPIASVNRVARQTLAYARSISDNVTAIHITDDEAEIDAMRTRWTELGTDIPLVIIESPYRSLIGPLLSYIDEIDKQRPDDTITVVLPEFVARHWWEQILHNQSAFRIKAALLFRPGTVVTSVPYHLQRD